MLEHQPHPGTTRPAWAIASPEYLAKHATCNHAWGTCNVPQYADQRAHNTFWETAAERNEATR